MSSQLHQELSDLIKRGFVEPSTTIGDLRDDLHETEIWADMFWGRRKSHLRRIDPEIDHVIKLNPSSILEIGIAYGRVAAKILDSLDIMPKYTGIEVCKYFQKYIPIYQQVHPMLENVDFIFDNLFTTKLLDGKQFDMIILPMNTLPSFPQITVHNILEAVKKLLTDNGKFIFSTYKVPKIITNDVLQKYMDQDGSETIETEKGTIELDFTQLYLEKTEYGIHSRNYHKYSKKDNTGQMIEFAIFQNQRNFWKMEALKEIIGISGFKVDNIDDGGHSLVFVNSED